MVCLIVPLCVSTRRFYTRKFRYFNKNSSSKKNTGGTYQKNTHVFSFANSSYTVCVCAKLKYILSNVPEHRYLLNHSIYSSNFI